MKRALVWTLFFASCASMPGADLHNFELRPGAKPTRYLSTIADVHKGGLLCAHSATVRGIEFDLDVSCESGVVVWIQTSDRRFRTAEGLSAGHPLKHAVGTATDEGVLLPSGWIAKVSSSGTIASFESPVLDEQKWGTRVSPPKSPTQ